MLRAAALADSSEIHGQNHITDLLSYDGTKKSRHDFKEILPSVTGSPADLAYVQLSDQVSFNSYGKKVKTLSTLNAKILIHQSKLASASLQHDLPLLSNLSREDRNLRVIGDRFCGVYSDLPFFPFHL